MNFLNGLQERSWVALGQILEPSGLHFGAFLAPFSGSWDIVKSMKNLWENTTFEVPGTSRKTLFPTSFPRRLRDTTLEQLLACLTRFSIDFGVPGDPQFPSFFEAFFLVDFYHQKSTKKLPKRLQNQRGSSPNPPPVSPSRALPLLTLTLKGAHAAPNLQLLAFASAFRNL